MPQDPNENTPILPIKECYELLSVYGVRAIRFKKLPNETMYHQEISLLAKVCLMLIMRHEESPQLIITQMETVITNSCNEELKSINEAIQSLFNKRKIISSNNAHGEQEITRLTIKIHELEERKIIPTKQMTQHIIYDTLKMVGKNSGIDIPDEFNSYSSEFNATKPTPLSEALNEAFLILEKNV